MASQWVSVLGHLYYEFQSKKMEWMPSPCQATYHSDFQIQRKVQRRRDIRSTRNTSIRNPNTQMRMILLMSVVLQYQQGKKFPSQQFDSNLNLVHIQLQRGTLIAISCKFQLLCKTISLRPEHYLIESNNDQIRIKYY